MKHLNAKCNDTADNNANDSYEVVNVGEKHVDSGNIEYKDISENEFNYSHFCVQCFKSDENETMIALIPQFDWLIYLCYQSRPSVALLNLATNKASALRYKVCLLFYSFVSTVYSEYMCIC